MAASFAALSCTATAWLWWRATRSSRCSVLAGKEPASLRVVGLMSGTSVDGIDVAVCDVCLQPAGQADDTRGNEAVHGKASFKLVGFRTEPWPEDVREEILSIIHHTSKPVPLAVLGRLNFRIGEAFSAAVRATLQALDVRPGSVDLVASHGQTIFHDPPRSTMQIGEPSVIATSTGITTVGNFRVADVAVGGQGAPLASTFDWLLMRLGPGRGWRAVQNIGGIGNVTLLPPLPGVGAAVPPPPPLAFDTGPGNALIDLAAQAADPSLSYDDGGKLGRSGTVCSSLLHTMLQHPYLREGVPKSTGREVFSKELFDEWAARGRIEYGMSAVDLVATLTEFTAVTIADAYRRFLPPCARLEEVVVAGGGARNPFLMERLAFHVAQLPSSTATADCRVVAHGGSTFVESDSKEAVIFAVLGVCAIAGFAGNVPACTGASRAVPLGQLCPGQNWRGLLAKVGDMLSDS